MNKLLLLSGFVASFTELFPEYGMSYFIPPNNDIEFYDNVAYRRVLVVLLAWLPITYILYNLSRPNTIIAILFIMTSFSLRYTTYLHDKYKYTGVLHLLGFTIILNILYTNCANIIDNMCKIKATIGVLLLLIGGFIMGKFRTKNDDYDKIGRILFSVGFLLFINILSKLHFFTTNHLTI
jgi:hypothetical protein